MATTTTKVPKVICRNRRKVRNTRNQATFNRATRWIPFYINPAWAVISPTNDPRDLLFCAVFRRDRWWIFNTISVGSERGRKRWGFSGTWGRVTNTLLHMMSAANFISLFLEQKQLSWKWIWVKKNKTLQHSVSSSSVYMCLLYFLLLCFVFLHLINVLYRISKKRAFELC